MLERSNSVNATYYVFLAASLQRNLTYECIIGMYRYLLEIRVYYEDQMNRYMWIGMNSFGNA